MKKEPHTPHRFESISDAHKYFELPKPKHPLVSLMKGRNQAANSEKLGARHVLSFYKISYKPKLEGRIEYGQGHYDFDEGGLLFAAPGQIIGGSTDDTACSEYSLLVHPDFFLGYPLAKKIRNYGFFSYSIKETLHLSEEEKSIILSVFSFMESELNSRIDDFSHDVVISQMELLLTYADRFYKRQFLTRQVVNNDLLQKFESLLENYFKNELSVQNGIPTVSYFADNLNLSASYLSDMLRSLTGQSTQQHIHERLIYEAKEILSTTNLSVGEVAFKLGFEHSQSFNNLFKTKTKQSPLEFRKSFN